MDLVLQKKTELLNRIEVILKKVSQIDDAGWFDDRNKITLILTNLANSLNN